MANHALPTTASTYANYTAELDARLDDLAVGLDPAVVTVTNPPTNTIRYTSATARWQKWNGSAWVDLAATYQIAITGNAGTATTLQTARTINTVSFNGSANIVVEPYVEQDLTTAATRYITFVDSSVAGHQRLNLDDSLSYNPSTNTLTVANLTGTASTATNVAGGVAGAIHAQTGAGVTGFSAAGSAGQVLTSAGAAVPTWTNQSALSVGTATTATNLAGGSLGTIPYQSAAGTTAQLAVGTSGYILKSNGAAAPSWLATLPVANGGTGGTTQATALQALGAIAAQTVAKSAVYTVVAADRGDLLNCTGTWTLSLTAAATLADGFSIALVNSGTSTITIDPNASELVDGVTTKGLPAGGSCLLVCNGVGWYTVGGTTTNIAGGLQGSIPYQTAAGATALLAKGTAGQVLTMNAGATAPSWAAVAVPDASVTPAKLTQPLTLATAQATTSGTAKDFTGIPSWVKRITVAFEGVSSNGTSVIQFQVGSGSVQTTGYSSQAWTASAAGGSLTSGLYVAGSIAAGNAYTGVMTLVHMGANKWVATGIMNVDGVANVGYQFHGKVTLSGALDRLRLTTINGTDTFDAGSVNIMYE